MSNEDITLWGIGTSRTMRAHWMLVELGLEYELHPIRSRTGETMTEAFLELNPKHKIPVLRHGRHVLSESAAIISYLSETFEAPDGFYVPDDAPGRSRLNEWCFFIMMELDAIALYVIRRHGDLSEIYGEAPRAVESARVYFDDQVGALVKKFDDGRDYLMAEGMSIADILLMTCLGYARMQDIAIPKPLVEYQQRLARRPAYRQAFRSNFPDRSLEEPG